MATSEYVKTSDVKRYSFTQYVSGSLAAFKTAFAADWAAVLPAGFEVVPLWCADHRAVHRFVRPGTDREPQRLVATTTGPGCRTERADVGQHLHPHHHLMAIPIAVAAGTADVLAYTGAGVLFGWSARETVARRRPRSRCGRHHSGWPDHRRGGLVAGACRLCWRRGYVPAGLFVDRSLTGTSAIVLYVSRTDGPARAPGVHRAVP